MAKERRSEPRMALVLPVKVQGHDESGAPWNEMSSTDDASFGGASLVLQHSVGPGHVLELSLPLPRRFRRYDLTEPGYHVWALVRDVVPAGATRRVGVMFLGKTPPKDYDKNPGGRYLLPTDAPPKPKERRRYSRLENAFLNLKLHRLDPAGAAVQEERTVAENLGKGGARVMTAMPLAKGDVVLVEEIGGEFKTRAEIRNVYIGEDRIPRLNLQFLDAEAPDRMVAIR
ncbi:MAG TPA: PilZ domain-containing protein [Vicinamibacteria bacterium]|nr:PilZ domain-containing protein [Vicinamibacteria bacterium]